MQACRALYLKTVAQGYDPTQNGDVPANRYEPYGVMKGQGSGTSSIMDMVTFLKSNIKVARGEQLLSSSSGPSSRSEMEISRVLLAASSRRIEVASDDFSHHGQEGIGWQYYADKGRTVTWKSGDSEGTSSIMLFNTRTGRYAFAVSNCAGGMKSWEEMRWKPIQVAGLLLVSEPPPVHNADSNNDLGFVSAGLNAPSFVGEYSSPQGFLFAGAFDARHVHISFADGARKRRETGNTAKVKDGVPELRLAET